MSWTSKYDNIGRDDILTAWDDLKKNIVALKEQELDLRKYIVQRAFPSPQEGTNTEELGNGFKLKAVVKYNYKLSADNKTVEAGLDELSNSGNDGSFLADRLVSWSPNFLLQEYRQIQEDAEGGSEIAKQRLLIISKFMTITEAAPDLKIVEPKGKK